MTPAQIRGVLDDIEATNSKIHGYGSRNFARNLAACFEHVAERDISPADLEAVKQFAFAILERPMELIDGVEETVATLSERHDLTIFTKGDPDVTQAVGNAWKDRANWPKQAQEQAQPFKITPEMWKFIHQGMSCA